MTGPAYGDGRLPRRFWDKVLVSPESGCWEWTASRYVAGYGQFAVKCLDGAWRPRGAHRWAYEHLVGPVPVELVVDHLCNNPPCCNPSHMQIVTQGQNVLRGESLSAQRARMTHCPRGHELAGDNLALERGRKRVCIACRRARAARRRQRIREESHGTVGVGGGQG